MNRDEDKLTQRAKYVQRIVCNSKDAAKAIKNLSDRLFLSEKTIERDLAKEFPDTTGSRHRY